MDVLVTIHVPTEDGTDWELITSEEFIDANSQGAAISDACLLVDDFGLEGVVSGVRLKFGNTIYLNHDETLIEGGVEGLAAFHNRRVAASAPAPR